MPLQSQTTTCPGSRFSPTPPITFHLETEPGSGIFEPDTRLRLESVTTTCIDTIPEASFSIRLDNDFHESDARQQYHPDKRLVVSMQNYILFDGHPSGIESRWDGKGTNTKHNVTLTATGLTAELARREECWILGRHMTNAASQQVLVHALPCVFNAANQPNRAPTPTSINGHSVYLFTWDNAPDAEYWSLEDALRYLLEFYQPSNSALDCTTLLDSLPTSFGETLDELGCDTLSLQQALKGYSNATNIRLTTNSTIDIQQGVSTALSIVPDPEPIPLNLAAPGHNTDGSPRFDASSLSAADVFDTNEVYRAVLTWDSSRIVNTPLVVGGIKRYEVTVPLVPGWEPAEHLDNVDLANRPTAKGLALLPDVVESMGHDMADTIDWYRRYHRKGSEHAAYRSVGRTWILNEDNRCEPSLYNRNPPFDNYSPFDFASVIQALDFGEWTIRPRPFNDCITISELNTPYRVYIEVSFDSGTTWQKATGTILTLKDRAGIHFDLRNPTSMTPDDTDPANQNLWYALIDQTFRVRVTATIEGDTRLLGMTDPPDESPVSTRLGSIEYTPTRYRYATRTGTTDVLGTINPDGDIERDDSDAIQARSIEIADNKHDTKICITPAIPWLDTRFVLGDHLSGIPARNITFNRPPTVIGKTYRLTTRRYETELILA